MHVKAWAIGIDNRLMKMEQRLQAALERIKVLENPLDPEPTDADPVALTAEPIKRGPGRPRKVEAQ